MPSRATRSIPKKSSTRAATDVLSQLASCVAAPRPFDELPAALHSLCAAIDAEQCVVERVVGDASVVVAVSPVAKPAGEALVDTRQPITALGGTVGTLIARSQASLSAPAGELLATAAHLISPALVVAELTYRAAVDAAESMRDQASEHQFTQQVLDSLPLGLHVVDRDYRIRAWNRKRETGLQGVQRDEALGRSIFEVLRRQPETVLRAEFDSVFESGEIVRLDIVSGTPDDPRIYRVSKIPMRDDADVVTHVITVGEDVTDAVRAQEEVAQARKLAAVGTLAAGAMHEINNPLATIGACAETLAMQLADPLFPAGLRDTFAELCDIIDHEVHRSKRILNGLLDFSRPTGATRSPAEMLDIIEQTLRLLKYHPTFSAMHVEVEIAPGERLLVRADRDQLVQVLMALMLNAMDAMSHARDDSPEGVSIPGARRGADRGGDRSRAAAFLRARASGCSSRSSRRSRRGAARGSGLSICYGIVADHGGRIEVDSTLGKGSTFRVILPLAESAA